MYGHLPIEIIVLEIYSYLTTDDIMRARGACREAFEAAKRWLKGRHVGIVAYRKINSAALLAFKECASLDIWAPGLGTGALIEGPEVVPSLPIHFHIAPTESINHLWPDNVDYYCTICDKRVGECGCRTVTFRVDSMGNFRWDMYVTCHFSPIEKKKKKGKRSPYCPRLGQSRLH